VTLEGRVAIVTGAGQGTGLGAARALAQRGALVVFSNRTKSKVDAAVAQLARPDRVLAIECDVTRPEHITRCVDATIERFGRVDVLVHAADAPRRAPLLDITEDDMLAGFTAGVLGGLRFMQAVVPLMIQQGGGSIVHIASGAGPEAEAGSAPYASAKEALRTLSRVAAVELGPHGIRVNVVCPITWSPSFERWVERDPERYHKMLDEMPLRRIGDPVDDVGAVIAFLAGDEGRYLTGGTLMADGGATHLR
jgi:NAD(P)-dependent dehydrogenase (short-subunit alcohol dehydrogenase family)